MSPFNEQQSAQFADVEILKYSPPYGTPRKSVVLKASDWSDNPEDGTRFIVPAGTILKRHSGGDKHIKYDGTGVIDCILAHSTDLLSEATSSDEPAAAWWVGVVFATIGIASFTQYASALVHDLNLCKFE